MIGEVEGNQIKKRANSDFPGTALAELFIVSFGLILTVLDIYHSDISSLDVEGAELEVIKTIPFDKVKIDFFFIEYVVWSDFTDVSATQKPLKEF